MVTTTRASWSARASCSTTGATAAPAPAPAPAPEQEELCRSQIGPHAPSGTLAGKLLSLARLSFVLARWTLMYLALPVSYLAVLVLAVPAAGFPGCTHTVLPRLHPWLGLLLAVGDPWSARSSRSWCSRRTRPGVTSTPSTTLTSADLDRRGCGDAPMMERGRARGEPAWGGPARGTPPVPATRS